MVEVFISSNGGRAIPTVLGCRTTARATSHEPQFVVLIPPSFAQRQGQEPQFFAPTLSIFVSHRTHHTMTKFVLPANLRESIAISLHSGFGVMHGDYGDSFCRWCFHSNFAAGPGYRYRMTDTSKTCQTVGSSIPMLSFCACVLQMLAAADVCRQSQCHPHPFPLYLFSNRPRLSQVWAVVRCVCLRGEAQSENDVVVSCLVSFFCATSRRRLQGAEGGGDA